MNKNITKSLLALLACSAAFCACSREEADLFDQSAADRLNSVSGIYSERLTAKGGEWIMEYFPTTVVDSITSPYAPMSMGYLMLNKFRTNGSVTVGMSNAFSNNRYAEDTSAWEVLTDLGPVLSYNTYNQCLHTFSNPEQFSNSIGQGDNGTGVGGDYEFVITSLDDDCTQAMLKGKKRGAYTRMTRLPEGTNFQEYFASLDDFVENHFPASMPNDLIMTIGNEKYYVRDLVTGIANIWPYGTSWADTKTYHPYILSKHGEQYHLRFRDPIVTADESSSVQELVWDDAKYSFVDSEKPENTIHGLESADMPAFFAKVLNLKGWKFDDENMSESVKATYEKFRAGLLAKNSKYNYQDITIKNVIIDDETVYMMIDIYFKQGVSTKRNLKYYYTCKVNNGTVEVSYVKPVDKFSTDNIGIEGVQDIVDLIGRTHAVSAAADAGFLINKVILTDPNNSNSWFQLNYIK